MQYIAVLRSEPPQNLLMVCGKEIIFRACAEDKS